MLTIEEKIARSERFAKLCGQAEIPEWQEECEQIVAWLRELQERRKAPEIIRCSECAFCRPFLSNKVCSLGLLHNINSDMDFCSRAVRKPERRTDENNNLHV